MDKPEIESKKTKQVLYSGLESILNRKEFNKARNKLLENTVLLIVDAHKKGELEWLRTGEYFENVSSKVSVKNAKGEDIEIYVTIVTINTDFSVIGKLYLFTKSPACIESSSMKEVAWLIESVTGEKM